MDFKIAGDTHPRFMVLGVASSFLMVTGRLTLYISKNLCKNILYTSLQLVEEVRSFKLVLIKADCREAVLFWAWNLTEWRKYLGVSYPLIFYEI